MVARHKPLRSRDEISNDLLFEWSLVAACWPVGPDTRGIWVLGVVHMMITAYWVNQIDLDRLDEMC